MDEATARGAMFGRMQSATVRVAVDASAEQVRRCLTEAELLQQWVWPQRLDSDLPSCLIADVEFYSRLGPIRIGHRVKSLESNRLALTLWGGIDGWNEWRWGDGWVQLHVEAVSLLPLHLGLNVSLQGLRQFLKAEAK